MYRSSDLFFCWQGLQLYEQIWTNDTKRWQVCKSRHGNLYVTFKFMVVGICMFLGISNFLYSDHSDDHSMDKFCLSSLSECSPINKFNTKIWLTENDIFIWKCSKYSNISTWNSLVFQGLRFGTYTFDLTVFYSKLAILVINLAVSWLCAQNRPKFYRSQRYQISHIIQEIFSMTSKGGEF